MDMATVIGSVKKTNRCITIEEGFPQSGIGAEIGMQIMQEAFDYLDAPIVRVAAPNIPPPSSQILEKAFLPNDVRIMAAVKEMF